MANDDARAAGFGPRGESAGELSRDCSRPLSSPLKNVWHGFSTRVFTGWKPVPQGHGGLHQQAVRSLPQALPYGRGSDGWSRITHRRSMNHGLPVVLSILFSATIARAHSVTLECEVQPPDRVVVTVYWGGTEPAVGAAIVVTDAEGHEVASGISDKNGSYTFTATAKIAYTLEATIAGHRARRQLSAEEVALLNPPGGSSALSTTLSPAPTVQGSPDREHEHDHPATAEPAHVHPPQDSSHAEALAGVALILSAASFLMIVSLRRRLDTHIKRDHNAPG